MSNLYEKTIEDLVCLIRDDSEVANELIEETKDNISKWEGEIGAFITLTGFERNFTEKDGALSNIPFSVKDNICTKDVRTTAASKILSKYIPPYNATVVERVLGEGGIMIGKNNLDEFGHGFTTETSAYKTTLNPYDISRLPGGSSGGSAAAVACGMGLFSIATENWDSIRMPAAVCGVVGFKPSYGVFSRYGIIAMASSLECPGIIARSVEDVEYLFKILIGKDDKDAMSVSNSKIRKERKKSGKIRIGFSHKYLKDGVDLEIKSSFISFLDKLTDQDYLVEEIDIPDPEIDSKIMRIIYRSEVSSNLARYDGIRFGFQPEKAGSMKEFYLMARSRFGSEVKRQIVTDTLSIEEGGDFAQSFKQALKERSLARKKWEEIFDEVEFIISPSAPNLALKKGFGEKCGFIGGKIEDDCAYRGTKYQKLSDMYSLSAVLYGFPAISIPLALSQEGLPMGLNIFTRRFDDTSLLTVAKELQELIDFESGRVFKN